MSFDVTKNYLKGRLEGLAYIESKEPFDFEDASARSLDKRFILSIVDGAMLEDGSENLATEFIDFQTWQVAIAFEKSEHSDVINRDDMYRSIEPIIKDLDNPSNYLGTVRFIRYETWEVEELGNYYVLRIQIKVQDRITY